MGSLLVFLIWCLLRQPIGITYSGKPTEQDIWTWNVAPITNRASRLLRTPPSSFVVTAAGRSPTLPSVFVIAATITPAWARHDAETLQGAGGTARMAIDQLEDRIAEWTRK